MKKVSIAWFLVAVLGICSLSFLIGSIYLDNSLLCALGFATCIVACLYAIAVNWFTKPVNSNEEFYMDWSDVEFEEDIKEAFALEQRMKLKKMFQQLEEDQVGRGE